MQSNFKLSKFYLLLFCFSQYISYTLQGNLEHSDPRMIKDAAISEEDSKSDESSEFFLSDELPLRAEVPPAISLEYKPMRPFYHPSPGSNVGQIVKPGKPWPANAEGYANFSQTTSGTIATSSVRLDENILTTTENTGSRIKVNLTEGSEHVLSHSDKDLSSTEDVHSNVTDIFETEHELHSDMEQNMVNLTEVSKTESNQTVLDINSDNNITQTITDLINNQTSISESDNTNSLSETSNSTLLSSDNESSTLLPEPFNTIKETDSIATVISYLDHDADNDTSTEAYVVKDVMISTNSEESATSIPSTETVEIKNNEDHSLHGTEVTSEVMKTKAVEHGKLYTSIPLHETATESAHKISIENNIHLENSAEVNVTNLLLLHGGDNAEVNKTKMQPDIPSQDKQKHHPNSPVHVPIHSHHESENPDVGISIHIATDNGVSVDKHKVPPKKIEIHFQKPTYFPGTLNDFNDESYYPQPYNPYPWPAMTFYNVPHSHQYQVKTLPTHYEKPFSFWYL